MEDNTNYLQYTFRISVKKYEGMIWMMEVLLLAGGLDHESCMHYVSWLPLSLSS
jgi:hypothetical protein